MATTSTGAAQRLAGGVQGRKRRADEDDGEAGPKFPSKVCSLSLPPTPSHHPRSLSLHARYMPSIPHNTSWHWLELYPVHPLHTISPAYALPMSERGQLLPSTLPLVIFVGGRAPHAACSPSHPCKECIARTARLVFSVALRGWERVYISLQFETQGDKERNKRTVFVGNLPVKTKVSRWPVCAALHFFNCLFFLPRLAFVLSATNQCKEVVL
jgi:hypothetical protein